MFQAALMEGKGLKIQMVQVEHLVILRNMDFAHSSVGQKGDAMRVLVPVYLLQIMPLRKICFLLIGLQNDLMKTF